MNFFTVHEIYADPYRAWITKSTEKEFMKPD